MRTILIVAAIPCQKSFQLMAACILYLVCFMGEGSLLYPPQHHGLGSQQRGVQPVGSVQKYGYNIYICNSDSCVQKRKVMRLDKHVNAYKPIANHLANIQYDKQKKVRYTLTYCPKNFPNFCQFFLLEAGAALDPHHRNKFSLLRPGIYINEKGELPGNL